MGYEGADVVDLSARLVGIVEPGAAGGGEQPVGGAYAQRRCVMPPRLRARYSSDSVSLRRMID